MKDQLSTAVDQEEEGQMSSDRSVDYVSDRRLKLRKGHERKMHAERCFASQKVSSAADFQRDETVNANERVDKTGADDSAGRRPTVRSKQHAVQAQRLVALGNQAEAASSSVLDSIARLFYRCSGH